MSREAQDWAEIDRLVGEVVEKAAERLGEDAPAPKKEKKEPGAEEWEEGR